MGITLLSFSCPMALTLEYGQVFADIPSPQNCVLAALWSEGSEVHPAPLRRHRVHVEPDPATDQQPDATISTMTGRLAPPEAAGPGWFLEVC